MKNDRYLVELEIYDNGMLDETYDGMELVLKLRFNTNKVSPERLLKLLSEELTKKDVETTE